LDDDVSDKELQDAKHYEDDERLFEIKTKRGWLISKNNEWFQGLYALLFDFSEAWIFDDVSELTSIIKLSDDSFNYLKESVYFLDTEHSDSEFKFVNQATYISGKNKKQQDKSKKFLEYIGVENLDESIHIKLLFENYKFESKEQHIEDINRLIKFYTDENEIDREFREFSFVYTNSNNIVKPSKIAIDSPFEVTGLKYVASYQDTELLNSVYKELHNKGAFLSLIKSLGANDVLVIEKTSIRDNPDRYILVRKAGGARWTDTAINRDWIIEGLDEMLADQEHPREISKLVWNTMCTVSLNSYNEEFKAQYRKNSSYRVQERKSQLIHTLSNANWIPDKDGRFCNPKDIDMELLPLDFVYNNENKWLDLIEFGLNVQFTNDERDNAKELVVSITGMSVEQLEQFKNTGISPERMLELAEKETQRLGDAIDRSQGSGGSEEVDQGGKDNDDEIIINIEEFQKNIGDEYEGMDVQIVDTKVIVKKQNYEQLNSVKEYLYKQYKGHCQICGDTFKKEKDGKYHFVKYSLNRVKKGDVKKKDINRNGNTLSLCPKHHSILKLGLVNFSFSNVLNGQSSSIDIDFIRENFKFSEYLGRDDYKAKNDAFYALPENDNFERGVYLLPIKLFTRIQYLKFTEDHIMHFIKTWNEY